MRPTFGAVLAIAWCFTTPSAPHQNPVLPPTAPTGTAAISGVITDGETGRPIAGASIMVAAIGPDEARSFLGRRTVLTDARGRFVLADLPAGPKFNLVAFRSGYGSGRYGETSAGDTGVLIGAGSAVTIALGEGEWRRDADIRLWRLGTIGGRVVDERGEAVVGAPVRLFSRRFVAGREHLLQGAVASTDDRGIYRFESLRPGRYYVAVLSVQATVPVAMADGTRRLPIGGLEIRGTPPPAVTQPEVQGASLDVDGRHRLVLSSFATPPPPDAGRPRAYAPVFYPGARTLDTARAVEIGRGTSVTNLDFELVPVAAVKVSGRVAGPVADAAHLPLRLMTPAMEHLGAGSEVATTVVEADGQFTFLHVPAGSYTLVASPAVAEIATNSGSDGNLPRIAGTGRMRGLSSLYLGLGLSGLWWRSDAGAGVWGRVPLSVGDADVEGFTLALQRASTVSGRLVFDDPVPPGPSDRFPIALEPANGDPGLGVPNTYTDAGDPTHAFTVAGLQAGRYVLRISFARGWIVRSVTAGGIDVTTAGFDAAPGRDIGDVVVTMARAGAVISGVVQDAAGRPAHGAVIVFPSDARQWVDYGWTPVRLRSVRSGSDGSYELGALPDGEYLVVAVPVGQGDAWVNPAFLAAAAAQATSVTLRAGTPATRALRVSEVVVR